MKKLIFLGLMALNFAIYSAETYTQEAEKTFNDVVKKLNLEDEFPLKLTGTLFLYEPKSPEDLLSEYHGVKKFDEEFSMNLFSSFDEFCQSELDSERRYASYQFPYLKLKPNEKIVSATFAPDNSYFRITLRIPEQVFSKFRLLTEKISFKAFLTVFDLKYINNEVANFIHNYYESNFNKIQYKRLAYVSKVVPVEITASVVNVKHETSKSKQPSLRAKL